MAELRDLGGVGHAGSRRRQRPIRGRLAEAEARFAADPAAAEFQKLPESLRRRRGRGEAQGRVDALRAVYVRWAARLAAVAPESPVPADDIATLVGKKLPEFVALLESFEEGVPPATGAGDLQDRLKDLSERKEELEKLRTKIERDGLEQLAAALSRKSRGSVCRRTARCVGGEGRRRPDRGSAGHAALVGRFADEALDALNRTACAAGGSQSARRRGRPGLLRGQRRGGTAWRSRRTWRCNSRGWATRRSPRPN